jgi:hypothetical protein
MYNCALYTLEQYDSHLTFFVFSSGPSSIYPMYKTLEKHPKKVSNLSCHQNEHPQPTAVIQSKRFSYLCHP